MSKAREPKRIMFTLEACAEAGEWLKRAGFVVANVSIKSEAVYYRFPGRWGVIRVSDHSGGKERIGLDVIHAKLTFLPHAARKVPGTLTIGEQSLRDEVCRAIGRYMMASAAPERRTYSGPKQGEAA